MERSESILSISVPLGLIEHVLAPGGGSQSRDVGEEEATVILHIQVGSHRCQCDCEKDRRTSAGGVKAQTDSSSRAVPQKNQTIWFVHLIYLFSCCCLILLCRCSRQDCNEA